MLERALKQGTNITFLKKEDMRILAQCHRLIAQDLCLFEPNVAHNDEWNMLVKLWNSSSAHMGYI
ncbi:hypothetical protein Csa_007518 [Cucumis sativus]|uniref:Uncharacterized protein n=1 Tax=Cucumis sativus TaxID=3659 RepID=A0A0A0M0A7_CUCSA|nr:hypothetical protein Csa_007518 [Cucumis sativus]